MGKTSIEWCEVVWNPISGCTKVSAGCRNCYAERMAKRFWGDRLFSEVRCHPERLGQPLHWRRPRRVFVDSMSDLWHPDVPDVFIAAVFGIMTTCQHLTFQILTKRAEQMAKWFQSVMAAILKLVVPTGLSWPLPKWIG